MLSSYQESGNGKKTTSFCRSPPWGQASHIGLLRVCLSGPRQSDRDGWRSSVNSGLQGCQISMFWDPGSTPWPEDPAGKGGSKPPTPMPFVNRSDPDQLQPRRSSQNSRSIGRFGALIPRCEATANSTGLPTPDCNVHTGNIGRSLRIPKEETSGSGVEWMPCPMLGPHWCLTL